MFYVFTLTNLPVLVDYFFLTFTGFFVYPYHGFLSSLYLYYPFTLLLFHSLHSNLPKVVLHGPHVHTCGIHHKTQKSIAAVVSKFLYMLLAHTWFFNASVLASTLALLGTGRPPITTWLYLLLKSFFSVNDLKAK